MAGRQRYMLVVVVAVLVLSGALLVVQDDDKGQRIGTSGAIVASAGVTTVTESSIAAPPPPPTTTTTTTTSSTVAASPAAPARPPATTTTRRRPVATTVALPASVTTTTAPALTAAGTATASVPATVTTQPTTTTTLDPCRNSTDSTCGPFRFDPQPGADRPMTVEVTIEPASPVAGQPAVFHITLRDPDGVSYDGTTFNFGNGGTGGSTQEPCAKYGPWDPPAPDPASATEAMDVTHTYFEAGSYTATFLFDAGPFDCVDAVTGRGDRPYASSATGTVTVQVGP